MLERVHSYMGEGGLITMNHELEAARVNEELMQRRKEMWTKVQSLPGNKFGSVVSHAHVCIICNSIKEVALSLTEAWMRALDSFR